MHDTLFRVLTIAMDGWQNVALVILLGDRIAQWRRTRRLMAAINAETER